MAWVDLEAEIAEIFGELAEAVPLRFGARSVAHLRAPAPYQPNSRRRRVLAAVAAGARTPRAVAALASADVTDVRHDLQNLRREGRVRRGKKGWIL